LQAQSNIGITPTSVAIRSYLAGLTLSTAGASTVVHILPGVATDSTNVAMMALPAAVDKLAGAWVVGSGQGGFDTGTIAANTWYHVFLIKRVDTGVVDVLISLSATAPTLPTNYTQFRRIGSMKTNASAQWTKFIQTGDTFMWDVPAQDVNVTNPGVAAVLRTLSTPLGVKTQAIVYVFGSVTNAPADSPGGIYLSDPAQADLAAVSGSPATVSIYLNTASAIFQLGTTVQVTTDANSQIRSRVQLSAAGTVFVISTLGYFDRRGRDS
jgi:hypothetical protein